MQVTVETTEVELDTSDYADTGASGGQVLIIQNLGAGDLYFDFQTGVAIGDGIKVASGGAYEVPNWKSSMSIFLISNTSADVRYAAVG